MLFMPVLAAHAQMLEGEGTNRFQWGRDSTHNSKNDIPIGVTQFTVSPLLGEVIQQEEVDTLMRGFQKTGSHDGEYGSYNHTGAYGSPRLSRLYMERPVMPDLCFFTTAYDYFRPDISTFRFSNTKSPITNLSFHRAGSSSQGNDRLRAYFATNVNKQAGIGFLLDYLYSRGQYNFQQNSMFDGSVYGYYHGDRYQMNAWFSTNNMKMAESGGITDDNYITHPENFERSFNSRDIPTQLSDTWNRNDDQTYYLTHRFNLGYKHRLSLPDSLMPHLPPDEELLRAAFKDSILRTIKADTLRLAATLDSLRAEADKELLYPEEFIPVASVIHTFKTQRMNHRYSGRRSSVNAAYYAYDYYYGGNDDDDSFNDQTTGLAISNTLALSLREGFRPWVKAGLTAFVTHDHIKYTLPDSMAWKENNISVGGTFARVSGRALRFNATGQVTILGELAGDLNIDGTIDTRFRLLRDTCSLSAHAYLRNDKPNFFFRHYHSRYAQWDNNLDQEVRTRIEGAFRLQRVGTTLKVGVENITNYTYLATTLTPNVMEGANPYTHAVAPEQAGGSVQVLAATLQQDFHFGLFHWENHLTWQKSSRPEVLPLPDLNYWTDLYLKFRIAHVLNMQIGADMRYFTRYEVPDYSPIMNAFTTQDRNYAVTLGGYPIIDFYVNAHLKHFRAYLNFQHLNASFMSGDQFLAPHYPIDPMVIHFGISWNFFN